MTTKQQTTYKVERLDGTDEVPYFFQFKADAIRVANELNKTNKDKPQYYVKQN